MSPPPNEPRRLRRYAFAAAVVVVATLGGVAASRHASLADEAMVYSLAILIAAYAGRGPGVLAAALSVVAFDFAFVEPRFTLAVADTRFLFTFVVMFVVGAAIGGLVARLRAAEAASRERERTTAALLSFTRDAAAAVDRAGVLAAVTRHVQDIVGGEPTVVERPGAQVTIDVGHAPVVPERVRFLEAVVRQATTAIEKLQLAETARDAEVRATTEELRNALLSAVSHDLRTPLAVITGMATSLRERAPASEREGLDTIVEEAERLSRILQNLLAVTKVEAGAQPRREWVPIEELVGQALERLDDELAGRDVRVACEPDTIVHIDPILGELLLVNLVENATKHTPPGTPIEISAWREGEGTTIGIADRGPGLPEGTEKLVFERFFRLHPATTKGVGLGLAVCRGITVAHGGTIDASPREGGGTVFVIRVPDAAPLPSLDEPPSFDHASGVSP